MTRKIQIPEQTPSRAGFADRLMNKGGSDV